MTHIEIDKALIDILAEKKAECEARLKEIPKENKSEKKAVHLELGMYTLCQNAGFLVNTTGGREGVIRTRRTVIARILEKYPELLAKFEALDEEDQLKFIAALQAEMFLRDQMLPTYCKELETASAANDTDGILEMRIKIGTVESVLDAWEAWRRKNNVFPGMIEGMK
ncbi:MAG: hypothetical protein IJY12_00040 [Clostridia bacterium]|nr:hypothetical protein [Clostridia bacterium]